MVKFSKQFECQLVPEWKEAFVDYWQLKKDIKKIHLLSTATNNIPTANQQYSLPKTLFSSIRRFSLFGHERKDHGVIQVLSLSLSLLLSPQQPPSTYVYMLLVSVVFVDIDMVSCEFTVLIRFTRNSRHQLVKGTFMRLNCLSKLRILMLQMSFLHVWICNLTK